MGCEDLWLCDISKEIGQAQTKINYDDWFATIDLSSVDDEDGEDGVTDAANDPPTFLEIWYVFFRSFVCAENLI